MTRILSTDLREFIVSRATSSHVADKIDLESTAADAYTITVMYAGEESERFTTGALYAVNVADWVAEWYEETAYDYWDVSLSSNTGEDAGYSHG